MSSPSETQSQQTQAQQLLQYNKRIIVKNLPPGTSRDELRELGDRYGRVISVELVPKQDRPFGFISFLSEDDAGFSIYRLNGYRYKNYILEAALSSHKPQGNPKDKKSKNSVKDDKPKKSKRPIYSLRTLTPLNPPTLSTPQQQNPPYSSFKSWDPPTASAPSSNPQESQDNGFVQSNDSNKKSNPGNKGKSRRNNNSLNRSNKNYKQVQNNSAPAENNEPQEPIVTQITEEPPVEQVPLTDVEIKIPATQFWVSLKLDPVQLDEFLKFVSPLLPGAN